MGSTTFLLPDSLPPGADALLRRACFAGGYDQSPIPTRVEFRPGQVTLTKSLCESGFLTVPWPVDSPGCLVLTTTTLRERPEPYCLMVELARGKLNQVRVQAAEWQGIGLVTPPEFDRELTEISKLFGAAALNQPSAEADAAAARVLDRSAVLADLLVRMYVDQVFASRKQEEGRLEAWLSARIARAPAGAAAEEYRRAFNAAAVAVRWRDLEPAESHYDWTALDEAVSFAGQSGLPVTLGPIIDLAPGMLPTWAAGWEGDLPTLAAFMCDFLETVIARYRGRVARWVICAGFNHHDGLGLSDDERLRLAHRLFEAALQLDPELHLVVSVAQPWGDYMVSEEQTISPLAFADDLIRMESRVSAVEVELRYATTPRGSLPRDLLDTARVLDMFSLLNKPVEVVLSCPAGPTADPQAAPFQQSFWPEAWRAGPDTAWQSDWGVAVAGLGLCSPHVRSVTWDHWDDRDPHFTPVGGLLDASGDPRPLLTRLGGLRKAFLG